MPHITKVMDFLINQFAHPFLMEYFDDVEK